MFIFFPYVGYRLVIICNSEEEEMSHFISKLHFFRRPFISRTDLNGYKEYLISKFTVEAQEMKAPTSHHNRGTPAAIVDIMKYVNVHLYNHVHAKYNGV